MRAYFDLRPGGLMPLLSDVESLQGPRQTTGPDSVRPGNSLDVRLVVVGVDVMAIPRIIRYHWQDGEVAMKSSMEVGDRDGAMHVS